MDVLRLNAEALLCTLHSRRELDEMEMRVKELKASVHTKKLRLDCPYGETLKRMIFMSSEREREKGERLRRVYDQLVLLKCRTREHDDGADVLRDTLAVFTAGPHPINVKLHVRERIERENNKTHAAYSLSWSKQRHYPFNAYRVSADDEVWRIYPDGSEPNTYHRRHAEEFCSKMMVSEMEHNEFIKHLSHMILEIVTQEGYLKRFHIDKDVSMLVDELLIPEVSNSRKQGKNRKCRELEPEADDERELGVHEQVFKRLKVLNIVSCPTD